MTAEAAFSFAVVCEAEDDREIACDLAERVLLEKVDWLQPETLRKVIEWRGLDRGSRFISWKAIGGEARRRGIRLHGQFRSAPGAYDESRARLALRLFLLRDSSPDAVLLVRDTDCEEERLPSLERARNASARRHAIVLATPDPKRECWVLAGFEPSDDGEKEALEQVRSLLGFDPRLHAERLSAKGSKGKKNAKKILGQLMPPRSPRERLCWQTTDLDILEQRGQGSRLSSYLEEISRILVPVVAGVARSSGD